MKYLPFDRRKLPLPSAMGVSCLLGGALTLMCFNMEPMRDDYARR